MWGVFVLVLWFRFNFKRLFDLTVSVVSRSDSRTVPYPLLLLLVSSVPNVDMLYCSTIAGVSITLK